MRGANYKSERHARLNKKKREREYGERSKIKVPVCKNKELSSQVTKEWVWG